MLEINNFEVTLLKESPPWGILNTYGKAETDYDFIASEESDYHSDEDAMSVINYLMGDYLKRDCEVREDIDLLARSLCHKMLMLIDTTANVYLYKSLSIVGIETRTGCNTEVINIDLDILDVKLLKEKMKKFLKLETETTKGENSIVDKVVLPEVVAEIVENMATIEVMPEVVSNVVANGVSLEVVDNDEPQLILVDRIYELGDKIPKGNLNIEEPIIKKDKDVICVIVPIAEENVKDSKEVNNYSKVVTHVCNIKKVEHTRPCFKKIIDKIRIFFLNY